MRQACLWMWSWLQQLLTRYRQRRPQKPPQRLRYRLLLRRLPQWQLQRRRRQMLRASWIQSDRSLSRLRTGRTYSRRRWRYLWQKLMTRSLLRSLPWM